MITMRVPSCCAHSKAATRLSGSPDLINVSRRGRVLRTFETIVDLIGHTSTATGLRVRAKLDKRRYRLGVKVTVAEMRDIALHRHECHGDWNYDIHPRAT